MPDVKEIAKFAKVFPAEVKWEEIRQFGLCGEDKIQKTDVKDWGEPVANVREDQHLEKMECRFAERIVNTEKILDNLLATLAEIKLECQMPGWDGYAAKAVSPETVEELEKLLKLLPSYVPAPYIAPAPTGAIVLEWRIGRDQAFALSVKGKGVINYHVVLLNAEEEGNKYAEAKFKTTIPLFIQKELFSFFCEG